MQLSVAKAKWIQMASVQWYGPNLESWGSQGLPGGRCYRILHGSIHTAWEPWKKISCRNMKEVAGWEAWLQCTDGMRFKVGWASWIFLPGLTACHTTVQVCTLCKGCRVPQMVVGAAAPFKLAGPSIIWITTLSWSLAPVKGQHEQAQLCKSMRAHAKATCKNGESRAAVAVTLRHFHAGWSFMKLRVGTGERASSHIQHWMLGMLHNRHRCLVMLWSSRVQQLPLQFHPWSLQTVVEKQNYAIITPVPSSFAICCCLAPHWNLISPVL